MKLEKNIFKITEGVYGYISMRQSFYCVLDDDGKVVLFDCGHFKNFENKIRKILDYLNKDIQDIKCIFITHADGDHIGGLGFLKKKVDGLKIYSSQKTKEYVNNTHMPEHYGLFYFIISFFYKRKYKNYIIKDLKQDVNTLNMLGGIKVISTPGHTDDHFSYFIQNRKILFVGDVFMIKNNKLLKPYSSINQDNGILDNSIVLIGRLDYNIVCAGHGNNFFSKQ